MGKKALFLSGLLLLGVFPLQSLGQMRISRTTELRKYLPINYGAVYGPRRMLVRASQPAPGAYYSRNSSQPPIIYVQNAVIFINDNIREYPSNNIRGRTQASYPETSQSAVNDTSIETRIRNMEIRLNNLENLASQNKQRLNNIPSQSSMPAGYEQRLVRLEEQMQDLRDVLAELRNFLKSKK